MKISKLLFTFGVVGFWLAMNGLLVKREIEYRSLDLFRQGLVDFLGRELHRERWLGIYRDHRKIGYTGIVFSKSFEDDGIRHYMTIDSLLRFDLFGQGNTLRIRGSVVSDHDMVPESMDLEIRIEDSPMRLEGRRDGESFVVVATAAGGARLFEIPLPLEQFCPTDGFFPSLPVSGFEVGQSYDVPVFDPIFRTASRATVNVLEETTLSLNGLDFDCFRLETSFRGMKYTSWVTPDGEVIRQEVSEPFRVVLKRESSEEARRGIVGR